MLQKKTRKISPFSDLIRQIKINNRKEMLSIKSRIPKAKRAGSLQPVIPLVPIKLPTASEDKGKFVAFELKTRVGAANDSTKYKKYVRIFEEGTPQEWIDLLRDLNEIWTQNSMNGGQDRASTVRALIKGESEVAFDAAFQEARTNAAGEVAAATAEHVQTALQAVTATVFPHRALEIQKLWMTRRMYKPQELTTRQTAAAINRVNNCLPLFPTGTDASKFTPVEIIGLLEWSLPPAWRAKFDLDGYVPTLHSKARLIEACEAIERNEETTNNNNTNKKSDENGKKSKNGKSSNRAKKSEDNNSAGAKHKYYCSEHGHNSTHDTSSCFTLKNRADKAKGGSKHDGKKEFSNRSFRKELNLLAKQSSKKKVLDLYASAIKREQAKLAKKSAKKRERAADEDSGSDSDAEAFAMSETKSPLKSALKKAKKRNSAVMTDEEKEYQRKISWLKDHGEPLVDASTELSDEENADDTSESS